MQLDSREKYDDRNPNPLIAVDLSGKLCYLNRAASSLLNSEGWSSDQYANVLPPDYAQIIQNCKEAEIGIPATRMEFSSTVMLWTPFFGDSMDQVLYTGVDITRLHRNELALIMAKEKAEEGERLKSAFLDNMSHEIRTPLNSLLGFMNLLSDELTEKLDEDQKFYFSLIQENGFRLERTMREILDMSNFSSGTYTPLIRELEVVAALREIVREQRPAIEAKRLEIDVRLPLKLIFMNLDTYCFKQTIIHLLDNATKYTAKGTLFVSLKERKDAIEIRIEDTGNGMSEDAQRKIFLPFNQGSIGHSKQYQGIGLGLSLVRAYCDAMGASIDLRSEGGQGSRYLINIPK